MAISLQSLQKRITTAPPLLLIYGVAGMGKTSMALNCPDTVYIQIAPERPPHGIEADSFGELKSYREVLEALASLDSADHSFKHIVIDSIDALEPLIWRETCLRCNVTDIEKIGNGYGKGYLAADHVWREIVDGCNILRHERGIAITWLALAKTENHEEPGKPPYKRYTMRLQNRAESMLTQSADAVLFLNTKVQINETEAGFGVKDIHATGGGTRWLFTDGRPAFIAKNRFRMPADFSVPEKNPWSAIAKFLPGAAQPTPVAETVAAPQAA